MCRGNGLWEEVGYREQDSHFESRCVLNDFTDDASFISASRLFQNGTASNAESWVGWMKRDSMGNSKRQWVILNMD